MRWKVEELSRRLKEAGYEAEPATIKVWEGYAKRVPQADTLAFLEHLFGSTAPVEREMPADLMALAKSISELAAAVREQTEAQDAWLRETVGSLVALAKARENGPEPVAPGGAER